MARKLSVSVPDELWDRAQTQRPDLNPSHLVQTALEAFTRPADTAGFSLARPEDTEEGFAAAKTQLASMARAEFESGYRAAVRTMPALSWWDIQGLAEGNFDVAAWAKGYGDSEVAAQIGNIPKDWAPDPAVVKAIFQGLGGWIMPYGAEEPRPTIPFLRGFARAFRELWTQVNEGNEREADRAAEQEVALGQ
jgi:hypothetical protein